MAPLTVAVTGSNGKLGRSVVRGLREAGHTVVRKDPPISPAAAAGAMSRWMLGAERDAERSSAVACEAVRTTCRTTASSPAKVNR